MKPAASTLDFARFARRLCLGVALLLTITGCAGHALPPRYVYFPKPPPAARAVHLISFNSLGELVSTKWTFGEVLRGRAFDDTVETPGGIAYHDGRLYVCDIGENVVHEWNLETGRPERSKVTSHEFGKPVDVDVDCTGAVHVADSARGRLVTFKGEEVIEQAPVAGWTPVSVACVNEVPYAADAAGHALYRLAPAPDNPANLTAPGELFYPAGVAADPDGRVYVSDSFNGRVQVFAGDPLKLVRTIGQPGDRYGDLGSPRGLDVSPQGVLFIADPQFGHVHLFNTDGALLMLLGGPGSGPGTTPLPVGVAVAADLPQPLRERLVPPGFAVDCFLFVTNTIGERRITLYAIGKCVP